MPKGTVAKTIISKKIFFDKQNTHFPLFLKEKIKSFLLIFIII